MSNKSVLGSPDVVYHGGKTTFPISQDFTFTASAGMLLPAYKCFLNAGEKISGCPRFFLRTNPLLAPSMTDIDVYVDCFFVPMRHMYSMFEQWMTQVSDSPTDLYTEDDWITRLPVLRDLDAAYGVDPFSWMTKTIFDYDLFGGANYNAERSMKFHSFGYGLHRLTQHLGYNPQAIFINCASASYADCTNIVDDQEMRNVALSRYSTAIPTYYYAAYQKIYMDVYRDTNFEGNNVKAYNVDSFMNQGYGVILPLAETTSSTGLAKYPRLGMFQLRFRNRNKDYFTAIRPNPLFNSIGMLPLAADNLKSMHNWLLNDEGLEITPNGLTVSLDGSDVIKTSDDIGHWDVSGGTYTNFPDLKEVKTRNNGQLQFYVDNNDYSLFKHDHTLNTGDFLRFVNVASLRSAFAFEKLLQVTNRAGRHVDDQVLAQFGVKLPVGVSNETYKIKSYHTMVHLGEVISTAQTQVTDGDNTTVTPLGEMAGRGIAILNSDDGFSFRAPTWGVFMAIFSISPRYKYVGAIEKDGFKINLADFFRPQTDDLGQQPMFMDEINSWIGVGLPSGAQYSERNGWQWRYMEDKIKFDKASYTFLNNGDNPWCFCSAAPSYASQPDKAWVADLPGTSYQMPNRKFFNKVGPGDLNKIFVTEFDGRPEYPDYGEEDEREDKVKYPVFLASYLRDPFKVDFSMKAVRTSYMSRFGEPELGSL